MITEAKTCRKCDLCKTRTNVVIGKGNEKADILFVGEAPGKNEDLQGLPFVGKAGTNLDNLLSKINLSISNIYIANILKCRPPENRDPTIDEVKTCTPWLIKQIKIMKPKVICTLGNYATKFFLSNCKPELMKDMPGITQVHGKSRKIAFDNEAFTLIPLFHPAAIIYNRSLLPKWEEDMETVKKIANDHGVGIKTLQDFIK